MRYSEKSMQKVRDKWTSRRRAQRQAGILTNKVETGYIRLENMGDVERMKLAQDPDLAVKFNDEIIQWAYDATRALESSASFSKSLSDDIRPNFKSKDAYGLINKVGFSFPRHGIYIHKGAGRGYGGWRGSKWEKLVREGNRLVGTGIMKTTDPESLGKMDWGNRRARRWFDSVMERELPKLDQIVSRYFDTLIVNATNIYIDQ